MVKNDETFWIKIIFSFDNNGQLQLEAENLFKPHNILQEKFQKKRSTKNHKDNIT